MTAKQTVDGAASKPSAAAGPWSPLKSRAFAVILAATLLSNIGMWVRDVASGWLMTDLSPSPLLVALVQAALMLPVFLLALPAGALADILDRRKMLIAVQTFILLVSVALSLAVVGGLMTPWVLLALTFLGGIGAAMLQPTFQAVVPELVERDRLKPAIALNSMGVNISRAVGPALGGAILVSAGVAAAYAADAFLTLFVVMAFMWWRRQAPQSALPPEALGPAIVTGVRYVARSGDTKRVLLRAGAFFIFASSYWALLPLIARDVLQAEAAFYGLMLTAVGAGAVFGALLLPRLAANLSANAQILLGGLATAGAIAALALAPAQPVALALLFLAGAAWITVLTNLNVAAQSSLPNWVRARGLSVYLMVFYGSMAAGSAIWGQTAQWISIDGALFSAAAALAISTLLASFVKLPEGEVDRTPAGHWPEPAHALPVRGERGPVMVTVEYRIDQADRSRFLEHLYQFSNRRKRDGAFGWRVFEDAEDPARFTEVFFSASWLEHLRQHLRITRDDAAAQQTLRAFDVNGNPRVTHQLAAKPGDMPAEPVPAGHEH